MLAAILVAIPGASAATIEFGGIMQADGIYELDASGVTALDVAVGLVPTLVIEVFEPGVVRLDAGTRVEVDAAGRVSHGTGRTQETQTLPVGTYYFTPQHTASWPSIVAWGDVQIASGGPFELSGHASKWHLPPDRLGPGGTYPDNTLPPATEPIVFSALPAHFDVHGQARAIQLHNWLPHCAGQESCPDAGEARREEATLGNVNAGVERDAYATWISPSMGFRFEGAVNWLGGNLEPGARLALDGIARLPQAMIDDNGTVEEGDLRLDGDILLADLSPGSSGGLSGSLTGNVRAAAVDERALPGLVSGAAAAQVAATAIAAFLAWKLLALLVAGIRGEDSELLRRIRREVDASPGISYRELMRATGVGNGTLSYHVHRLERHARICSRRLLNTKRFFPQVPARGWEIEVLRQDRGLAFLHELVMARPGIHQRECIEIAQQRMSVARATIQKHLRRLCHFAAIRAEGGQQTVTYWPMASDESAGAAHGRLAPAAKNVA